MKTWLWFGIAWYVCSRWLWARTVSAQIFIWYLYHPCPWHLHVNKAFFLYRDISKSPLKVVQGSFCFKLARLPHRGCSLLEVEGSLSQRQKLTAEVSALAEEEQKLEQLIQRCSQDMRHMSDSASNQKYPFRLWPTLHPEDRNDSRLPLDLWTFVYVNKTTLLLATMFWKDLCTWVMCY